MKQRINIKFCYKLGKTPAEKHEMLIQVYGTDAQMQKMRYDWCKRFRKGKESANDEAR